jgi:putative mRNA 3-end processing factor
MGELITTTEKGLFCEAGGFYVDPWMPVDHAVVTHAHSDHARPGSKKYLTTRTGAPLLRRRVQKDAAIDTLEYDEALWIRDVKVSLHPAGHVLGSAQVRLEHPKHGVWVIGGDYKTAPDPTCASFEPVTCDVFVSESTFGLPVFEWQSEESLMEEILRWWEANREAGRTSMLYAYALGKAQRVLAGVLGRAPGPIAVHGAVHKLNEGYAEAGVELPEAEYASPEVAKEIQGAGLVIAPPSANATPWTRKFGAQTSAFASGWMRMRGPRRRRGFDHGFVMSDHADWPGLLGAIEATGAQRVLVTHGYVDPLVRFLREERGLRAEALATAFSDEAEA